MKHRRMLSRFAGASLAVVIGGFLPGLAPAQGPAASSAGTAPAAPAKILLGWSRSPDVPQIAEAAEKGLWKQRGLEVDILPFATGRDSFEALLGGQLDYAVMAEFPAVIGALRNQRFAVLASLSSFKAFRIIAKADAPVSLEGLAGKKIGVAVGTNVNFLLAKALGVAGTKAEIVNVAPPDLIPALVRGDIAAGMLFPSAYEAARQTLGAAYQEILLPDARSSFILVASERVIANEALHRKLLEGLLEGEGFVTRDPAASQAVSGRYVGKAMSIERVRAGWPRYDYRVQLDRSMLTLMLDEGKWLVERGAVKNAQATEAVFKPYLLSAPLKSLAPERVNLD